MLQVAIRLRQFSTDEGGATSIEYALVASLVSIAILSGVVVLGAALETRYVEIGEATRNAGP